MILMGQLEAKTVGFDLDVSRDRVKNSPPWDPLALIAHNYQRRLHGYYGWPGYGW